MKSRRKALCETCVGLAMPLFLLSCLVLQDSHAESAEKSQAFFDERSPFVEIAENVLPSVVNISSEKITKEQLRLEFNYPFFDFPFKEQLKDLRKYFKEIPPSFGQPPYFRGTEKSLGSGVLMSEDGYILTNNHVVSGAQKIVVTLQDKTVYKGDDVEVVGTDARTDLAVLKIHSDKKLQPVRLGNSDEIRIGDWAIAVGNPLGLNGSVTVGVISAKDRSGLTLPEGPSQQDFLQTDAAIHPGNSGGPLLNIKGEVIGINAAIASRTGSWQGIGFAIPINLAVTVYEQLIERGKVVRGWLGVYIQELTGDLMEALDSEKGVLVSDVIEDSPAEHAGFEPGDVIVEYDGKDIESVAQLQGVVAATPPGTKVKMRILRDGKAKELKLEIGEMPASLSGLEEEEDLELRAEEWLGLRVVSMESELREKFSVEGEKGVLVVGVEAGSPGDAAGIRPGDVLLEVGKMKVSTMKEYEKAREKLKREKEPILFLIERSGRKSFIAVTPESEP